jgi:hypothetical protein
LLLTELDGEQAAAALSPIGPCKPDIRKPFVIEAVQFNFKFRGISASGHVHFTTPAMS